MKSPFTIEGLFCGMEPFTFNIFISFTFRCVNEDPLNGSNWYKNGLTVPMKKLTNTQLKAKKIPLVYPDSKAQQQLATGTGQPEMTIEPEVAPEVVEEKTVKTSYGRQSKPVLVPIKTENVRCKHCQELFRSLYKLKQHMEKVHSDQLKMENQEKRQPCQKVLPLGYVPAPLHGEIIIHISMLRSAIFYQRIEDMPHRLELLEQVD